MSTVGLALFSFLAFTWIIFDRFQRSERIELKNVHVLTQADATRFTMEVQSRPHNGDWTQFSATFCPDSDITPEIQPGVTLLVLTYVEDIHLRCFDVRQPNGYVLWRDEHNAPILSSFARSTTTPCTDPSTGTYTGEKTEARAGAGGVNH